jgi:hypothetical protein
VYANLQGHLDSATDSDTWRFTASYPSGDNIWSFSIDRFAKKGVAITGELKDPATGQVLATNSGTPSYALWLSATLNDGQEYDITLSYAAGSTIPSGSLNYTLASHLPRYFGSQDDCYVVRDTIPCTISPTGKLSFLSWGDNIRGSTQYYAFKPASASTTYTFTVAKTSGQAGENMRLRVILVPEGEDVVRMGGPIATLGRTEDTAAKITVTADNLTPGERYAIQVDNLSGTGVPYTIKMTEKGSTTDPTGLIATLLAWFRKIFSSLFSFGSL